MVKLSANPEIFHYGACQGDTPIFTYLHLLYVCVCVYVCVGVCMSRMSYVSSLSYNFHYSNQRYGDRVMSSLLLKRVCA